MKEKITKNEIVKKIKKLFNNIGKRLKINDQKFNLLELLLLVAIAFVFGILISEAFVYKDKNEKTPTISSITNNNEIEKVYNNIVSNYYEDIDEKALTESAINGMMTYLGDAYSVYYNSDETDSFNEKLNGTYLGVGIEITLGDDKIPFVSNVFENTPASKVDIRINDKIIKIGDKDVTDGTLSDVVSLIKGEKDKSVKVTIKRDGDTLVKDLVTGLIDIPSISTEVFTKNDKKIGYIYISIFALNTDEQFEQALLKLEKEKIDSLIIDVRSNVGGHLSTVQNILNLFLNKDEILYQINKKGVITKTYGIKDNNRTYPVAVLINEASASASEILASAFKEAKKSDIVGVTSFGKGTVQQTLDLDTGGMIKITTETWLTSNGNPINKVGVTPTIEVKLSEKYLKTPTVDNDNQLEKAIDTLKNK